MSGNLCWSWMDAFFQCLRRKSPVFLNLIQPSSTVQSRAGTAARKPSKTLFVGLSVKNSVICCRRHMYPGSMSSLFCLRRSRVVWDLVYLFPKEVLIWMCSWSISLLQQVTFLAGFGAASMVSSSYATGLVRLARPGGWLTGWRLS